MSTVYIPFQEDRKVGDAGPNVSINTATAYAFWIASMARWRRYDRVHMSYNGAHFVGNARCWIEPYPYSSRTAQDVCKVATDNLNNVPVIGGHFFEGTVTVQGEQRSLIVPPQWRLVFDFDGAALPVARGVQVRGAYFEGDTMEEVLSLGLLK